MLISEQIESKSKNVIKQITYKKHGLDDGGALILYNDNVDLVSTQLLEKELENVGTADEKYVSSEHDEYDQPIDLRPTNSWIKKIDEVSGFEMTEVMIINSVVPFILVSELRSHMSKTNSHNTISKYTHVVNVSSPEGQFNTYKNSNHPHTNMAKAALNMMTRTSSTDMYSDNILMNSCDTSYITSMIPQHTRENFSGFVENKKLPPLKAIDGATRLLYPIYKVIHTDRVVYGKFFREFKESSW